MKSLLNLILLTIIAGLLIFSSACKNILNNNEEWKPKKPINLIVPWGREGTTDRISRVLAAILEPNLHQKINFDIENGASGSYGTKICMDAPKDGYTWTSGAPEDLGNYKVKGFLDTTINDWYLFLGMWVPTIVVVPADSKYKTFDALLTAFKENPGKIRVATAGVNSAGQVSIESIKKYSKIQYKHLPFDGGNQAIIALITNEADVSTQLSVDEIDMLRAGRIKALAVLSSEPLEVKNYGTIPPITKWIPDFKIYPIYFGIFIQKGVPENVIKRMGKIWDEEIKSSQVLKDFAEENGVYFDPCWGNEAQEKAFPMIQLNAWLNYDSGNTKINPELVGIPRPKL